ncbi:hypothetical protein EVA_05787 [gut metagenome]|uniref:Uncharacterized protein n=1 Tax=gut metagenome TaxID=749906 RepID=J9GGL7_9ZZZZ
MQGWDCILYFNGTFPPCRLKFYCRSGKLQFHRGDILLFIIVAGSGQ